MKRGRQMMKQRNGRKGAAPKAPAPKDNGIRSISVLHIEEALNKYLRLPTVSFTAGQMAILFANFLTLELGIAPKEAAPGPDGKQKG